MKTELKHIEKILLQLLRKGLWNDPEQLQISSADWLEVLRAARKQSVYGIVAKAIVSDRKLSAEIPNELKLKLKSFVVSNVMTYNRMSDIIRKTVGVLENAGLTPVLLKGHGLSVNYPYPELRQCGDIDLYVGESDALRAYDVLSDEADRIDPRISAESGKHFSARFDDVEVEIHRHTSSYAGGRYAVIYEEASRTGFSEGLQTVMLGETTVRTPSVDFNAYYIFDHLFEHFLNSGVGLRHLCDLMLYLHRHKDDIDRNRLGALLEKMKLMAPWQAFGGILVKYLGLPEDEFPFYAQTTRSEKVLMYIFTDGNFGKETGYYTRRSNNYILTKMNAFWCHAVRAIRTSSLFPMQTFRHFRYVLYNYLVHLREDIRIRISHGR